MKKQVLLAFLVSLIITPAVYALTFSATPEEMRELMNDDLGGGVTNPQPLDPVNGDFTVDSEATINTIIYADPNFTGDFGTYINGLCSNSTATTTTIILPSMAIASSSWIVPIAQDTDGHFCRIEGQGSGTILNYGGGASTSAITINNDTESVEHKAGMSLKHFFLANQNAQGAATTTINNGMTVGIELGGTNGSVHMVIDGVTLKGFGVNLWTRADVYDLTVKHSTIKAGGYAVYLNSASNSGEGMEFFKNWIVDPGNSNAKDCFHLSNDAVSSLIIDGGSLNHCQVYVNQGNTVSIFGVHFENTAASYSKYTPIYISPSVGAFTKVSIYGSRFWQSQTTDAKTPDYFIYNGGILNIDGLQVQSSGSTAAAKIDYVSFDDTSGGGGTHDFENINSPDNTIIAMSNRANVKSSSLYNPATDISSGENFSTVYNNPTNTTGSTTGIGFGVTTDVNIIGASIHFERQGSNSFGDLVFGTKREGVANEEKMRITSSATGTAYLYSPSAGKGGGIILEDMDGGGCSEINTLNGTIIGATVTCP